MKGGTLIAGLTGLAALAVGVHYMNSSSPQKQVNHYAQQKVKTQAFAKKTKKQWKKKKAIIPHKKNKFIGKVFGDKDLQNILRLDTILAPIERKRIQEVRKYKIGGLKYEIDVLKLTRPYDELDEGEPIGYPPVFKKRSTPKQILKRHMKRPFSYTASQLRKIVTLPHGTGGYIFLCSDGLQFKVDKTNFTTHYHNKLKHALADFVQGNYKNAGLLLSSTAFVQKKERKKLKDLFKYSQKEIKKDLVMIKFTILSGVFRAAQQNKINLIPKRIRQYSISNYRTKVLPAFLGHFPGLDNAVRQDYAGFFHVHGDGSEPTLEDIKQSKNRLYPTIVISAPRDKQNKTKIYIVHRGKFSKIYKGFLKSKN